MLELDLSVTATRKPVNMSLGGPRVQDDPLVHAVENAAWLQPASHERDTASAKEAATNLDFEKAAEIRDRLRELEEMRTFV